MHAEHQDLGAGTGTHHGFDQFETVAFAEADVTDQHVRAEHAQGLEGFLDAAGFAADAEIRLGLKQALDAFAEHAMVVEQQNSNHDGIIAQKPAGPQKNSWPCRPHPC